MRILILMMMGLSLRTTAVFGCGGTMRLHALSMCLTRISPSSSRTPASASSASVSGSGDAARWTPCLQGLQSRTITSSRAAKDSGEISRSSGRPRCSTWCSKEALCPERRRRKRSRSSRSRKSKDQPQPMNSRPVPVRRERHSWKEWLALSRKLPIAGAAKYLSRHTNRASCNS